MFYDHGQVEVALDFLVDKGLVVPDVISLLQNVLAMKDIDTFHIPPNSDGNGLGGWTHIWNDDTLGPLPIPVRAYGIDGTEVPRSSAVNIYTGAYLGLNEEETARVNQAPVWTIGHVLPPIRFGPYEKET